MNHTMNSVNFRPLLGLLIVSTLAACNKTPPAAPVSVAVPAAAPAPAPVVPAPVAAQVKKTTLDCDDRTIVLEATCSALNSPNMLDCTKQSLTVMERPGGAVRGTRAFTPQPAVDGDPPLVEEKIGGLSCERASTAARYIVANMFNGGNCEECEWQEVYDWNGKLVASNRDRKNPAPLFKELAGDARERVVAKKELDGFYAGPPR
jgi:hypothetical protein